MIQFSAKKRSQIMNKDNIIKNNKIKNKVIKKIKL